MDNHTQKAAIVTGGSGGIGQAIAQRLAADGFAVAVHYAGNAGKARTTVQAIEGRGGTATAVQGDIANQAPMQRIGQPDEIAAAVSFLAGPDGAWVNSQVLRVNGGFA